MKQGRNVNIWIHKAKQFMFTKKKRFQTTYVSILEDGASGGKVGDIEKINVKNLFKIRLHYIKLTDLWKKIYYDLKSLINSRNPTSKYLRSWNLHSKFNLISYFYASLLIICFEVLILIFYIWISNLTIEVIMRYNLFQTTFCYSYRHLIKKTMAFVYWSTFLVHFTMLAPIQFRAL